MTEAYVNSGDLSQEALALKKHGEELLNIYKGECSQALELSTECLQVSGLNTREFFQALEKIYTNLSERITDFADFLTNVVVVEYEAVNEAITQNFNNKFAQEMSSTLGIPMRTGGVKVPGGGHGELAPPIAIPIEDTKPGVLPKLPTQPRDEITVPKPPRDDRFEPVLFEESTAADSMPAVSGKTPEPTEAVTVTPAVKPTVTELPNNIAINKGNSEIKPVYFDEGSVAVKPDVLKPAVQPTPTTISSSAPASVSKPVSGGTASGPSGSVSAVGYSSGGGGGGTGLSALTYANLDSMSNPLRLNGRI